MYVLHFIYPFIIDASVISYVSSISVMSADLSELPELFLTPKLKFHILMAMCPHDLLLLDQGLLNSSSAMYHQFGSCTVDKVISNKLF